MNFINNLTLFTFSYILSPRITDRISFDVRRLWMECPLYREKGVSLCPAASYNCTTQYKHCNLQCRSVLSPYCSSRPNHTRKLTQIFQSIATMIPSYLLSLVFICFQDNKNERSLGLVNSSFNGVTRCLNSTEATLSVLHHWVFVESVELHAWTIRYNTLTRSWHICVLQRWLYIFAIMFWNEGDNLYFPCETKLNSSCNMFC